MLACSLSPRLPVFHAALCIEPFSVRGTKPHVGRMLAYGDSLWVSKATV